MLRATEWDDINRWMNELDDSGRCGVDAKMRMDNVDEGKDLSRIQKLKAL